ncbi:MAG: flippase [Anaerolineaceae bacterium]|nr:flippase [Anaerolineaceae bacterium]
MSEQKPQRTAGRTIARNTLFGIGAQAALRLLGLLFSILVVRRLGDAEFGHYSVVLAWAGLFSVIGDMGITQYMTREIAREPEKTKELFWNTAVLRFILAIIAMVVTVLSAIAKPYETDIVIAITLYTAGYFLQALLAPLQGIIAGNQRLDYLSVFSVIGQIIFMVAGGLFLFAGLNFIWLVVASLLNMPVLIALSLWVVWRHHMQPPRFHIEPRMWRALLLAGLPFAIIQLALTFNFQIDTLILETFQSASMVGWYNAAYNLTRAFLVLTSALTVAMPVTLAHEHALNPVSVSPWYYRTTKFMVFLGLPLAIGGTLLADKIIPLLYGVEYTPAAIAFAILIWDTPLLMYTALCGNLTTVIKKERRAMSTYLSLAFLNITLNLLFIPTYGLIAASVITVASELTGAILFYVFFRREFGPGLGLRGILRLGVAAVLMGVVVFLLHDTNLFINVSVSGAFYLVVVWLIGALSVEERAMLTGVVKRKLGGVLR